MSELTLTQLALCDMDQAAVIHRASFDDRLPWLSGLHTPEEDRTYYRKQVFSACQVWGAVVCDNLVGIIAFPARLDRSNVRLARSTRPRRPGLRFLISQSPGRKA
jgi:hypothetical protein